MKVSSRKGVSAIVAELLLLAITVTFGVVIFAAGSGMLSSTSSGFSLLFGHNAQAAKEIYVIEYVQFGVGPPENVTVTVRNVGFVETEVADISFFNLTDTAGQQSGIFPTSGLSQSHLEGDCVVSNGMVTVPVGYFCSVTVDFGWSPGTVYNVVVSTGRGNSVTGQFES